MASKIYKGVYCETLDEYSFHKIRNIRHEINQGKRPPSTQIKQYYEPLMIDLHNFPMSQANLFVFYDIAGEVFDRYDMIEKYIGPMKKSEIIWFFLSLPDFDSDDYGRSITDTLEIYRAGIERVGASLKDQDILVVYTKADLINPLPERVRQYLVDDPYLNLASAKPNELSDKQLDLDQYYTTMQRISNDLKQFTHDEVQGGAAFMSMAEQYGSNLFFCITTIPVTTDFQMTAQAYRIIDPLIWSIKHKQNKYVYP